jgi:hypothetical protein
LINYGDGQKEIAAREKLDHGTHIAFRKFDRSRNHTRYAGGDKGDRDLAPELYRIPAREAVNPNPYRGNSFGIGKRCEHLKSGGWFFHPPFFSFVNECVFLRSWISGTLFCKPPALDWTLRRRSRPPFHTYISHRFSFITTKAF